MLAGKVIRSTFRVFVALTPFDGLIIPDPTRSVKDFFELFYEALSSQTREYSHRKACTSPLGVPLLGYGGRPSEGLGFASPPDTMYYTPI